MSEVSDIVFRLGGRVHPPVGLDGATAQELERDPAVIAPLMRDAGWLATQGEHLAHVVNPPAISGGALETNRIYNNHQKNIDPYSLWQAALADESLKEPILRRLSVHFVGMMQDAKSKDPNNKNYEILAGLLTQYPMVLALLDNLIEAEADDGKHSLRRYAADIRYAWEQLIEYLAEGVRAPGRVTIVKEGRVKGNPFGGMVIHMDHLKLMLPFEGINAKHVFGLVREAVRKNNSLMEGSGLRAEKINAVAKALGLEEKIPELDNPVDAAEAQVVASPGVTRPITPVFPDFEKHMRIFRKLDAVGLRLGIKSLQDIDQLFRRYHIYARFLHVMAGWRDKDAPRIYRKYFEDQVIFLEKAWNELEALLDDPNAKADNFVLANGKMNYDFYEQEGERLSPVSVEVDAAVNDRLHIPYFDYFHLYRVKGLLNLARLISFHPIMPSETGSSIPRVLKMIVEGLLRAVDKNQDIVVDDSKNMPALVASLIDDKLARHPMMGHSNFGARDLRQVLVRVFMHDALGKYFVAKQLPLLMMLGLGSLSCRKSRDSNKQLTYLFFQKYPDLGSALLQMLEENAEIFDGTAYTLDDFIPPTNPPSGTKKPVPVADEPAAEPVEHSEPVVAVAPIKNSVHVMANAGAVDISDVLFTDEPVMEESVVDAGRGEALPRTDSPLQRAATLWGVVPQVFQGFSSTTAMQGAFMAVGAR